MRHPWFQTVAKTLAQPIQPTRDIHTNSSNHYGQNIDAPVPTAPGTFECESLPGSVGPQEKITPNTQMQAPNQEELNLSKLKEHLRNLPIVSSFKMNQNSDQYTSGQKLHKHEYQQPKELERPAELHTIQRCTPNLLKPLENLASKPYERTWNVHEATNSPLTPNSNASPSKGLQTRYVMAEVQAQYQPTNSTRHLIHRPVLQSPTAHQMPTRVLTNHQEYSHSPAQPSTPHYTEHQHMRMPSSESTGSLQSVRVHTHFNPLSHIPEWSSSQPQATPLRLRSASRQEQQPADLSEASKLNAHISLARQLFSATQVPVQIQDEERVVITSKYRRPDELGAKHQMNPQISTPERPQVNFTTQMTSSSQRANSPGLLNVGWTASMRENVSGFTSPKFAAQEEAKGMNEVSRSKSPGSQLGRGTYRSLLGHSKTRATPTLPTRQAEDEPRCPSIDTRAAVNSQHVQ